MDQLSLLASGDTHVSILVVDDHPNTAANLARAISRLGSRIQVNSATSGKEALDRFKDDPVDILLTDLIMPEMTGFELIEKLHTHPSGGPSFLFLMTAYDAPGMKRRAQRLNVCDVIAKPVHPEQICRIIEQAVNVIDQAKLSSKYSLTRASKFADLWAQHKLPVDKNTISTFDIEKTQAIFSAELLETNSETPAVDNLSVLIDDHIEVGWELMNTHGEINRLYSKLLEDVVTTFGASSGVVSIDYHGTLLQYQFRSSESPVAGKINTPVEWLDIVADSRQGFIVENVKTDERWNSMPFEQVGSAVVSPLWVLHRPIGFIILTHEQNNRFNAEHLSALQFICSQVSMAIENESVFTDISKERDLLREILRGTTDAILVFDADEKLIHLNYAGEQLFADLNLGIGSTLPPRKEYDLLVKLLRQACKYNNYRAGVITWPDQRIFSTSLTPVKGGGCVVTLHNVTFFKEWVENRNRSIVAVSNELQDPAAVALGFSRLMEQAGPLSDQQKVFVQRIQSATQKMSALLENLLQTMNMDPSDLVQVNWDDITISDLVLQCAQEFDFLTENSGKHIFIEKTIDDIAVVGNLQQLTLALRTLIDNAINHTPKDGVVYISCDVAGQFVEIKVKDNGFGIPIKDIPMIFGNVHHEHKGRTDQNEKTTGLVLVKSIVEQHGGNISVESELGKGTCFCLGLPLVRKEPTANQSPLNLVGNSSQGR